MSASAPANAIHLRLVQPIALDAAAIGRLVSELFERPDADWLGISATGARPGANRFLTDLSLPVRDHAPHMTFRKAALVDVGPVRPLSGGGREIEISWRSSSLAPLFPVFAGHLIVTPGEVRLEGYYAPPGGDVGLVLDRAFLNIAARGTARWFLDRATAMLTAGGAVPAPLEDRRAS